MIRFDVVDQRRLGQGTTTGTAPASTPAPRLAGSDRPSPAVEPHTRKMTSTLAVSACSCLALALAGGGSSDCRGSTATG